MGISAMPLSSCYAKPPLRGGLILAYGGADVRQIRDGDEAQTRHQHVGSRKRYEYYLDPMAP